MISHINLLLSLVNTFTYITLQVNRLTDKHMYKIFSLKAADLKFHVFFFKNKKINLKNITMETSFENGILPLKTVFTLKCTALFYVCGSFQSITTALTDKLTLYT